MSRSSGKFWDKKKSIYTILGAFTVVIPVVLLSCYAFSTTTYVSPTLQLISIIFRHGDRTPTHFYPKDPYKDLSYWPDGLGALTLEGKQQMFKLGKLLRQRYDGFLNDKYSHEEMYMVSSDHDRCLMSAQLLLAGLYPPFGNQIWNKDIYWQPIPVHTTPRNLDKLIVVKAPCPKYDKELNETYFNEFFMKVNEENSDLYKHLSDKTGMTIKSVADVETLYNTLEVEKISNLKLPEWVVENEEKMKNLATLGLAAFTFTNSTKRLKGGPLLGEVVKHVSQKVLGLLKPDRKLFLYSGHDLTLVSVIRALGFEEGFKPEYGASIIFELHQPLDEGDHLVEVLYLNNTKESDPIKLKIPGCEESCKLKDFIKLTKPLIPENWEGECKIT